LQNSQEKNSELYVAAAKDVL